ISPEETVRRLRQRGHPIRLFGETDRRRAIRLRQIEIAEEHSEGQQNDFMKKMEETETGLALEALQRQAEGGRPTGLTSEYDTTLLNRDLLKSDPSLAYTLVYVYLKRLLFEWGDDLAQRPEEIRTSGPGKRETATQRLSSEHLEPLFKRLKRQRVESDIIDLIVEIARCLQAREYLQANEAYLQMSIGNAAWPIGVTMVGIHARSAREKISSNQVAHVLNTEEQRKWIQSLKRLMTFAQNKYPPTDGAKAVG
ncbi:Prp18 domain-containing protein, partial [Dimargaris cristalligena]